MKMTFRRSGQVNKKSDNEERGNNGKPRHEGEFRDGIGRGSGQVAVFVGLPGTPSLSASHEEGRQVGRDKEYCPRESRRPIIRA
jgi:hypothetical protein